MLSTDTLLFPVPGIQLSFKMLTLSPIPILQINLSEIKSRAPQMLLQVKDGPNTLQPTIVSASWDKTVKVWNLTNCKIRNTLAGHSGYVNTVVVSPDGSLCASGGKDGVILFWDLAEGKKLYSLDAGSVIHSLCFSPNRYWLCAATEQSIKIWDLESKSIVEDLKVDLKVKAKKSDVTDNANKKKILKVQQRIQSHQAGKICFALVNTSILVA